MAVNIQGSTPIISRQPETLGNIKFYPLARTTRIPGHVSPRRNGSLQIVGDPVLRVAGSHENSRNPWPNCVPCPWVGAAGCIVPGSPHGLASRRGTVCVASIRWLSWSAGSAMSVPTTHGQMCLLLRVSRPYSFTVWFPRDGDSFPTFLFPRFRRFLFLPSLRAAYIHIIAG